MEVLRSAVQPDSTEFKTNDAEHRRLVDELRDRLTAAAEGGGERARTRHVERGKLLPRDRVERLLDPGAPVPRALPARRS